MTEADFTTIKGVYESVADEDSASYEVFRKKLRRLAKHNVRTTNRILRRLGQDVPRVRKPHSHSFVAYDGEGWGDKYVLLANSEDEYISNPDGLNSRECLEFLSSRFEKRVKRIFFSFSYDVNHIIKDFNDGQIELLLRGRSVDYEGFRVSYIPGKIFVVNGFRYYDVFSFFATSFINVVRKMLGPDRVTESLIEGKAGRGSFETWTIDKIIKYNAEELELLIEIMDKLKMAFDEIGVRLTQWYGPGAVAKFWFKEHEVLPQEKHTRGSLTALNSAYYGGRFEQVSLGKIKSVYEYDIHSAYPSVMVEMPYFKSWKRVKRGEFVDDPYSLWHISFDLRTSQQHVQMYANSPKTQSFMPLPVRSHDGRICFPMVGKGWYWYPEVKVMLDFFPDAKVTFHEGYRASAEGRPFAWIQDLYNYRRSLKDSGNLAQYAIKVGLNSLYGKTAQRVGRNPYFSLAWAGYITAVTRAKLARAGYDGGSEHVLGFATDALFTDSRFKPSISDDLGDWEESHFASAIFFQSGVYRLTKEDESNEDRYRGSPLRRGIDDIIAQLKASPTTYPKVKIVRFISHMLAVKAYKAYGPLRLQFIQVVHQLALDAPYKRHYYDFVVSTNAKGERQSNYARLLTHRINSTPKVFIGDNHWLITDEYLWGRLALGTVETQPPPMKDNNTQRLLDEAASLGLEAGYDDITDLDALPIVVEDEMK